jgi:hypothetical protein
MSPFDDEIAMIEFRFWIGTRAEVACGVPPWKGRNWEAELRQKWERNSAPSTTELGGGTLLA